MSIPTIPPAGGGNITAQAGGRGGETSPAVTPATASRPAAVAETNRADGAGAPASAAELNEALERVREALAPVARNLQFSVDDDTGKTVVRIIDSSTDEVIKQFPSEEMLAIARSIDKLQGLLLRQEA